MTKKKPLRRLHPDTQAVFLKILQGVTPQQMVRIHHGAIFDPFKYGDRFHGLGVANVTLTVEQYSSDDKNGLFEEDIVETYSGPAKMIKIVGPDYDTEGPEMVTVLAPHITSIKVHRPELDKGSSIGLFEALAGFTMGLAEGVAKELGIAPAEMQEKAKQNVYSMTIFNTDVPWAPEHDANVDFLRGYISLVSEVLPKNASVVDITYNGGNQFFDILLLDVIETPDGVILKYKDLGEYQGLAKNEIYARVINGQIDLPLPDATYYTLVKNLEKVTAAPLLLYAFRRLALACDIDAMNPSEAMKAIDGELEEAITITQVTDNIPLLSLEDAVMANAQHLSSLTTVVGITADGKTYQGLILTKVTEVEAGLIIHYRDINGYKPDLHDASTREVLLRLLAGQEEIPLPSESVPMLITSLKSYDLQYARDYAATTLLDERKSGRNILHDPISARLTVADQPPRHKDHEANVAVLRSALLPDRRYVRTVDNVVTISADNQNTLADILVVAVEEVDGGVLLTYRSMDQKDYATRATLQLCLIAGQRIPARNIEHVVFLRSLELCSLEKAVDYCARKILSTGKGAHITGNLPDQPYF